MKVVISDLSKVLKDNDQEYIDSVRISITHADPNSEMVIRKTDDGLIFHIRPSISAFKQHIIDNLLGLHRMFHLKIIFSKSLKISKIVSFTIELNY